MNDSSIHFVEVRVLLCVSVCVCTHMQYTVIRYGFGPAEYVSAASRKLGDSCTRALIIEICSSNNGGCPSLWSSRANKSRQQLT